MGVKSKEVCCCSCLVRRSGLRMGDVDGNQDDDEAGADGGIELEEGTK